MNPYELASQTAREKRDEVVGTIIALRANLSRMTIFQLWRTWEWAASEHGISSIISPLS